MLPGTPYVFYLDPGQSNTFDINELQEFFIAKKACHLITGHQAHPNQLGCFRDKDVPTEDCFPVGTDSHDSGAAWASLVGLHFQDCLATNGVAGVG